MTYFTPEIMEKNRFKLNEKETALLSRYDTKVLVYDFPEVLENRFFIEYNVEKKVAYEKFYMCQDSLVYLKKAKY